MMDAEAWRVEEPKKKWMHWCEACKTYVAHVTGHGVSENKALLTRLHEAERALLDANRLINELNAYKAGSILDRAQAEQRVAALRCDQTTSGRHVWKASALDGMHDGWCGACARKAQDLIDAALAPAPPLCAGGIEPTDTWRPAPKEER